MRDRTVAHPLALQHLDAAQTLTGDTPSAGTPSFLSPERHHPAARIALLIAPNSAHRPAKRPRHVELLGEARLHQEHHRVGLGDQVLGAIVMHRQSGDDDHALIRFDPQAAARIDDHGIGRRRQGQRQGFLGAHAAEQEADMFGSASPRPKSSWIQAAASSGAKKPDRYWSAPARPSAIPPSAKKVRATATAGSAKALSAE